MKALFEFLQSPFLGNAIWVWLTFVATVVALLAFDLGVLRAGLIGKTPAIVSLSVTFGLIAAGVIVSLWKTRSEVAMLGKTS